MDQESAAWLIGLSVAVWATLGVVWMRRRSSPNFPAKTNPPAYEDEVTRRNGTVEAKEFRVNEASLDIDKMGQLSSEG